jgi:putative ABC transport system permease protein
LWRDGSFAVAAVCTLALGIGASAAVFSVLNAVLLHPLPYTDPDRLAMIWTYDRTHDVKEEGTSFPNYLEWRTRNHSFLDMAVCARDLRLQVDQNGEASSVFVSLVSPNLFSVFGVAPASGRVMTQAEDAEGAPVALISGEAARRRFGTGQAVGRHLAISGRDYTIIGVMPDSFQFPQRENEFWIPTTSFAPLRGLVADRWSDAFRVVARLRPGVTIEDARADMARIGGELQAAYQPPASLDNTFAGFETNLVPMLAIDSRREEIVGYRGAAVARSDYARADVAAA